MLIGYHSSHEQFAPRKLLDYVQLAEQAGFQAIMSSDHFAPWSVRQGNSGNTWAWLGAAMQATSLPFGSLAIPGGNRYHPAILAQTLATLSDMFPERLRWIAAGSGEALNEHITGKLWPSKVERQNRLEAAISVIQSLWVGDSMTCENPDFALHKAKLWSLPTHPPRFYGAALSVKTAEWCGHWANGLITTAQKIDDLERLIAAFRRGGGASKPIILQLQISCAKSREEALHNSWEQWRNCALPLPLLSDIETTEEFDRLTQHISKDQMQEHILISHDPKVYIQWLQKYALLGFDEIYVHNVGRNQQEFIELFGQEVIPKVRF